MVSDSRRGSSYSCHMSQSQNQNQTLGRASAPISGMSRQAFTDPSADLTQSYLHADRTGLRQNQPLTEPVSDRTGVSGAGS